MDSLWQRRPIGELLSTDIDYRGKTPPESDSGIPTISAANVKDGRVVLNGDSFVSRETYQEWLTRGKPQSGDVLITTEAPVGEVALFPDGGPYLPTRRVIAMRCKDKVASNRFLKYSLQCNDTQRRLRSNTRGSTVSRVLKEDIFGLEIGVPPLAVQRRIADILGALDGKIELNRRMNETLEEMARALYRHWFVDFGPFQDREFKDTEELGPIPKEWEVTTVGDTTHINLGQSPKSKYYNEEGDGLVFHQGVSTYGWRFPVHERYCSKEKRVANEGDILISVRAPVGRLNIADRKLIIGRGLTALRREDGNQSFLFYFLKEFFDEENKIGSGTIFNSITKKVLNQLEMIGPPQKVVDEFESIVRPMDKRIRNNHEENQTLAETRDYLLPKLISGEIEVEAAQEVVEAEM